MMTLSQENYLSVDPPLSLREMGRGLGAFLCAFYFRYHWEVPDFLLVSGIL